MASRSAWGLSDREVAVVRWVLRDWLRLSGDGDGAKASMRRDVVELGEDLGAWEVAASRSCSGGSEVSGPGASSTAMLLDASETAAVLGVSTGRVYQLGRNGELVPARRRPMLWARSEVDAFAAGRDAA